MVEVRLLTQTVLTHLLLDRCEPLDRIRIGILDIIRDKALLDLANELQLVATATELGGSNDKCALAD